MVGILLNISITKGLLNTIKYHMNAIIDSVGSDTVVFDIYKTDKLKKLLDRDDVEFRHIPWQDGYTWKEYAKDVKKKTKDIDTLIVFASNITPNNNWHNHNMINGFERHLAKKDYTYSVNFVSTRIMLEPYYISSLCRDKNLIYFGLDPQECVYTDLFNTGISTYILSKDNKKYMPTYERYMFLNGKDIEKTLDFTFYGTAMNPDRQYLVDNANKIKKIKKSDVGIITKRDDTVVSQVEYYDKLAHSKFTLIIPSYDRTTFSIIRFLEAVSNHCLPLVLDTVDLTDLKNTFPDIYRIVKNNLIVDIDHIQDKINELDYEKIIKKIFNTKSVKRFSDLEYFKEEWSKII